MFSYMLHNPQIYIYFRLFGDIHFQGSHSKNNCLHEADYILFAEMVWFIF